MTRARTGVLLVAAITLLASCDRRRPSGAGAYDARVAEAIPQIEKATGLKFKTPPKLEVRSRAQVREFLLKKFDETTPAEQLRGEEIAYKLFGLIPDTMNLRAFLLDLLTEQIVGYYDPATKVLYVVEGNPDDLTGITITHELVHALQDQYLNLDSIQKLQGNSDRLAAAQAVLEGQATYEQMKIMLGGENLATRIPGGWDRVRELIRESQSSMPIFANAPMAIQESLLFPYLSGAEFVRRFEQHHPDASPLDSMPVSTELILSESAFFGAPRDAPTTVTLPGARSGAAREHEESLGEFGTRLLIFQHLKDHTAAMHAAAGWDGDRYRVIQAGAGRGIVWATVWDTAVDAAQFVDALGQAISRRYSTGAPALAASGDRTYSGARRTVVITPREIDGRNVVMYVDVPSGASPSIVDPARISIER
jgi:hypothetical protein